MSEFHLLRPLWLLGLLPWVLAVIWWWRHQRRAGSQWEAVVDPALRPYVIEGSDAQQSRAPAWLLGGWLLSLLALSGPVWDEQDVPVFDARSSRVILFDLSPSMLVDDLKPDRLARARFRLLDLLAASQGEDLALIAFSERPYVISPLTRDAKTISAFVPSLSPAIMPVQGSRSDLAMARAAELLQQAGVAHGDVLLITDGVDSLRAGRAAGALAEAGHRLSILGVGTATGAPLRDANGQFVRDRDGGIVVPALDMSTLEQVAAAGGGVAVPFAEGDAGVARLERVWSQLPSDMAAAEPLTGSGEYWLERGYWLLIPLAACALMMFRRGVVW